MRILVAEDDYASRRLFLAFLAPLGPCEAVENGLDAVEAFEAALEEGNPFEGVCLDLMMSGMDGRQVLVAIRRLERQRGLSPVPVVLVSALGEEEAFRMVEGEEGVFCLSKPVDQGALLSLFSRRSF